VGVGFCRGGGWKERFNDEGEGNRIRSPMGRTALLAPGVGMCDGGEGEGDFEHPPREREIDLEEDRESVCVKEREREVDRYRHHIVPTHLSPPFARPGKNSYHRHRNGPLISTPFRQR
jgi:hypothetical protein